MIHKLNFNFHKDHQLEIERRLKTEVVFIRPLCAKLFRVYRCPRCGKEGIEDLAKHRELHEVLTTLSAAYHKGTWYFRIRDDDAMMDIGEILHHMNVPHVFIDGDESFYN